MLETTKTRTRLGIIHIATAMLISIFAIPAAFADGHMGMAERWWNTLSPDQMVAALYGDGATDEQAMAAKMMYADLGNDARALVDAAATEIYGEGGFNSVGAWWESLDCRLMRVAAGDGIAADPMSAFCAHYPGSGAEKIMDEASVAWVNTVGQALLDREDPGQYPE